MTERIFEILEDIRPDSDFRNSKNFIEDYLLDSFDIMTLVTELENKYNIQIPTSDILPENYQSVEAIVNLISKLDGTV
jgi:acyl carrier protein